MRSLLLLAPAALLLLPDPVEPDHKRGFATLDEDDLEAHLVQLCTSPLEGRDSPSTGLERAAQYIEARFEEMGLAPAPGDDDYRRSFSHGGEEPVPSSCSLELSVEGEETVVYELGTNFVPVQQCAGQGTGEVVFAGFGIQDSKERYDDFKGLELRGKVAVILEGEPNHKKKFDGEVVSPAADLFTKLSKLYAEKVAGVVVVRRTAPVDGAAKEKDRPEPRGISFRHSYATWPGEPPRRFSGVKLPVVEVTGEVATALLGFDPLELAVKADRTAKSPSKEVEGRSVTLASATREASLQVDNVVASLAGSDPELADEWLVVGAHYDHIGVDQRGRMGFGADDNASGTAGMLEIAEALVAAQPRRSVLFCAFGAEEDGLVGSRAIASDLPMPKSSVVAMINLDMIGRGERDECAVLGINQNPELEDVLDDAKKLKSTQVKKVTVRQGEELFQRSDHYPFHQQGIPVLFFFEGLPISKNKDYHTWRDTIDKLDVDKMGRTCRLVYNTAWLLANDDDRPPAPSR